jgi:putative acetyltransferase
MLIRKARDDELEAVLGVERSAFGREEEALLVGDLLRDPSAQPVLSLVAVEDDQMVGHALFTAATVTGTERPVPCALLAPLAVLPSHQRAGLGRALIEAGCERLARQGITLVFVLGDPGYYMRCGFRAAYPLGLKAPRPIEPEAAWMVRDLAAQVPGSLKGTVSCANAIAAEHYWRE